MSDNLIDKTAAFVEAFNAEDLDAIMSFFADDGVFVGLDGTEHKGADRVRAALGATLGGLRFEDQDTFADLGQDNMTGVALHIIFRQQPSLFKLIARIFPPFKSTDHRLHVLIAHKGQISGSECRARALRDARRLASGYALDDSLGMLCAMEGAVGEARGVLLRKKL